MTVRCRKCRTSGRVPIARRIAMRAMVVGAFVVPSTLAVIRPESTRATIAPTFAGATSRALAARDPHLRRVARVSGEGGRYEATEGGRGFVGSEAPITGRVGYAHVPIALVALDSHGTVGTAAWLAYVAGRAEHVAVLPGGIDAYVRAGHVIVRSKTYDPDAPNCCPRHVRLTTYAWKDDTLVRVGTRIAAASERP